MPINYKDYPPNWKEIRARILERAGHKCEWCGAPNYFEHSRKDKRGNPVKVVLTIAHLDHDKENHNVTDDRLAALCQKCHLNYDRPRHVAKRKAKIQANKSMGLF